MKSIKIHTGKDIPEAEKETVSKSVASFRVWET